MCAIALRSPNQTWPEAPGASIDGFSLAEVTIVLAVSALLTAVLAPSIGDYVSDARLVKARSDIQVLGVAVARLAFDTSLPSSQSDSWSRVDVLVGTGQVPSAADRDTEQWTTDAASGRAGSLDDHLVTNAAGYPPRDPRYGGRMFSHGWAAPYLSAGVESDPWGHRYAVSVRHRPDGASWYGVVMSAGPDGVVQTPFTGTGDATESDDLTYVLGPRH